MKESQGPLPALGLESILGQDEVLRWLRLDLSRKRLASAYLFIGPDGVGKRTTARAFSAEALCANGRGCGECPSCAQFRAGSHPSYKEKAPSAEKGGLPSLKVEEVEEVLSEMSMQAYGGGRRFVLILDVHTGTVVGLNRMLKIVEEPPPGTTLILTAPSREAVLPTIASRCRSLTFRPLSGENLGRIAALRGLEEAQTPAGRLPWLAGTLRGMEIDEDVEEDLKAVEACLRGGFSSQALSGLFPPGVSGDRARVLGRLDLVLMALADAGRESLRPGLPRILPGIKGGGAPWEPSVTAQIQEVVLEAQDALSSNANTSLAAEAFCIRASRLAAGQGRS